MDVEYDDAWIMAMMEKDLAVRITAHVEFVSDGLRFPDSSSWAHKPGILATVLPT